MVGKSRFVFQERTRRFIYRLTKHICWVPVQLYNTLRRALIADTRLGTSDIGNNILTIGFFFFQIGYNLPTPENNDSINEIHHLTHVVAD